MAALIDHDLFIRLAESRDFLAAAAAGPVTIAEAAAQAHISRFHYLRLFHRAFGVTPYQFVQERRIALAKYLLSATDLPVTEICFEVGYESVGSFSTLFRQWTGLSPSDFRRSTTRVFAIRWAEEPLFIPGCFIAHYALVDTPQFSRSE
jgi:AraC-like DNA-binding protein